MLCGNPVDILNCTDDFLVYICAIRYFVNLCKIKLVISCSLYFLRYVLCKTLLVISYSLYFSRHIVCEKLLVILCSLYFPRHVLCETLLVICSLYNICSYRLHFLYTMILAYPGNTGSLPVPTHGGK